MTPDRKTEVQELTFEQLDIVAGGTSNLKFVFETLSNVSKTRSEVSMAIARNARA